MAQLNDTNIDGNLNIGGNLNIKIGAEYKQIVDIIYPIGSVYISVNGTNPELLFGGTWQQIKDKFLLSVGDNYATETGLTGGSADAVTVSHTHTFSSGKAASAGAHTHRAVYMRKDVYGSGSLDAAHWANYDGAVNTSSAGAHTHTVTGTISTVGVNGTGQNMPPYLSVYMYQRIA